MVSFNVGLFSIQYCPWQNVIKMAFIINFIGLGSNYDNLNWCLKVHRG